MISILLLPLFCRALEPVFITWNGVSLGSRADCSIATRETCNLDSLFTLNHLTSLAFLHADISTARLHPVNHPKFPHVSFTERI